MAGEIDCDMPNCCGGEETRGGRMGGEQVSFKSVNARTKIVNNCFAPHLLVGVHTGHILRGPQVTARGCETRLSGMKRTRRG